MTIRGRHDTQPLSSAWGIAMSTAMGGGILPRDTGERSSDRAGRRWPWSGLRASGASRAAAPRG